MVEVFIDADGCPVVDITIRVAAEKGVVVTILCDTSHIIERDEAKTVTVDKGVDSVDFILVNMLHKGDIVVTQDYGLAAMCLAREAIPINQNGLVFDQNNIESLLQSRYTAKKIRRAGGRLKGSPARVRQQDTDFEKTLKNLIQLK